jgi:hypothetical protein
MKNLLTQKLFRYAVSALMAVTAVVSMLAYAPAPVYAQSGGTDGGKRNAALEAALVRLNDWNTKQEINLRHAGTAGDKLQKLIDKAKAKGKDTAALETALAVYRTALTGAQADHDNAAAILSGHAGFDDAGKVTDAKAAKQTLESGRKALNDAHVKLAQAVTNLHAAINDWRNANPAPSKP